MTTDAYTNSKNACYTDQDWKTVVLGNKPRTSKKQHIQRNPLSKLEQDVHCSGHDEAPPIISRPRLSTEDSKIIIAKRLEMNLTRVQLARQLHMPICILDALECGKPLALDEKHWLQVLKKRLHLPKLAFQT